MKKNPKMFYSYINKQRNRKNEIGPFKKGEELIFGGEEICNCLKSQYMSQFSTSDNDKENEQIYEEYDNNNNSDNNSSNNGNIEDENNNIDDENNNNNNVLNDLEFSTKEIEDAIYELNENSSAGPDSIPAMFLKRTKETISLCY